jgi:hypothetical protein
MSIWNDFSSAEDQKSFDVIPKGTVARVRMTIKPGGYDDIREGWTGGYATRNITSGAVYLNCEFVVLEGTYARRKVWSMIGLYSAKGPEYANMGRSFIKGILNSARGVTSKDDSPQAVAARRINGFADLDGIEFVARIDVEKDQRNGDDRNTIKTAITKDHKSYPTGQTTYAPPQTQQQPAPQTQAAPASNLPTWAR